MPSLSTSLDHSNSDKESQETDADVVKRDVIEVCIFTLSSLPIDV